MAKSKRIYYTNKSLKKMERALNRMNKLDNELRKIERKKKLTPSLIRKQKRLLNEYAKAVKAYRNIASAPTPDRNVRGYYITRYRKKDII